MDNLLKNPWTYVALVAVAIIGIWIMPEKGGNYDSFATCLSEQGIVMYGTDWCPHCKDQKAMFGNSFKQVNYVNCDLNKEECNLNLVTGYPTWKINGQNYAGTQSLEKIAALSGCELQEDA